MSASKPHPLVQPHAKALFDLQEVGALCYSRNWSVGTSSNYSAVLSRDPLRLLITASGKDKRRLGDGDFVIVDDQGKAIEADMPAPSAETLLHVEAVQNTGAGAVLHTHSVWATILADLYFPQGEIVFEGYEMLKGLAGITTHETRYPLAIFENSQDIPNLAQRVAARRQEPVDLLRHGYMLRRHGIYTWGCDLAEARRQIEILEFLLECLGRRLSLQSV